MVGASPLMTRILLLCFSKFSKGWFFPHLSGCCVMIGTINLNWHDHFLQELYWKAGYSVRKSGELYGMLSGTPSLLYQHSVTTSCYFNHVEADPCLQFYWNKWLLILEMTQFVLCLYPVENQDTFSSAVYYSFFSFLYRFRIFILTMRLNGKAQTITYLTELIKLFTIISVTNSWTSNCQRVECGDSYT